MFTLKMCNISETTKAWKFIKYKSPNNSKAVDEEQLIKVFKEAVTEYKYNGLPDEYKQQFKMEAAF